MLGTHFSNFISSNNLFAKGDQLLLAVSGGVDSVSLCELCANAGYHFSIAHCNFKLRGEESERDAEFTRSLANKYGVPFFYKEFDTQNFADQKKISIQTAARQLRYEWFDSLLKDMQPPAWLLTAHHQDDNIETMLMNFFKGTGIAGLRGILPKQGHTIRPLLFASKEDIIAFAKEKDLTWVEDSSNANDKYTRNYFRNTVLPAIRNVYPEVEKNLVNNLRRFREVDQIYSDWISTALKKIVEQKGAEHHIPIFKLKKFPSWHSLLYEFLDAYNFSPAQAEEAVRLCESETGKFILSSTHRLLKNRNWLVLSEAGSNQEQIIVIEEKETTINFKEGSIQLDMLNITSAVNNGELKDVHKAFLDASNISFPLLLRRWKPGDYFYPLGMPKKKKLARFLIDNKVSLAQKEKIWVVESDKKVLWVVGLRIDDRFKITEQTSRVLRLSYDADK